MSLLVDTETVAPKERFDYWQTASRETYLPLSVRCLTDGPFSGRIYGFDLGAVNVYALQGYPSAAIRTPETIRASDPESFQLALCVHGSLRVAQDGRECSIACGDLTAVETSRAFSVSAREPWGLVAFMIPRPLLRPHADRICRQTALCISGNAGFGRLVRSFLVELEGGLRNGSIREGDAELGESILTLTRGLYLGNAAAVSDSKQTSRAVLLHRIKTYVDAGLADPSLSPEKIARAHFISVRHLHKLFEANGLSVCEWIRERRLDRCRRDLGDPALAEETVFTIAVRWGFTSQAHFSRLFRAAYGNTPREFRQELLERRSL
jgi:AraC-like DNA-binding protein